ncbi:zinc transporter ZntB [Vibrio variabilis]|uniref:zinc transporter ZntB n=1 Tax=Vibrio variabilis TaxID=990271 RepID=UPI000DD813E7|nr:zinc transporter ZntB [Vibrio variabilis]
METQPNSSYPNGLIHAIQLDGHGGLIPCNQDIDQVWQKRDEPVWLHFDYSVPSTIDWIQQYSGLNDVAIDGLTSENSRPHILKRKNNVLANFRAINLNPESDPEDMVSLRIWTDGTRIISTRRRPLISTKEVLESLESGDGAQTIPELLINWLDAITTKQESSLNQLEDHALELEEADFSTGSNDYREQVSHLRKVCIKLRRHLSPQKETLNQLAAFNLEWLNELDNLKIKALLDRQLRCLENIEMLREHSILMMDELNAIDAETLNRRTYVFTIIAGLFLPLGFFTGLLGINVGGMPGTENPYAFWLVTALCVVFSVGSVVWAMAKRWL